MKPRLRTKTFVLLSTLLTCSCFSQNNDSIGAFPNRPTIGFSINQIQNDYGLGLQFSSPFISNKVALRLRTNIHWLQHLRNTDSVTTWSPYFNLCFSSVLRHSVVPGKLAIYTEGGLVCILPSSEFASYAFKFGGFGLFGCEFLYSNRISQFFEVGGLGTGAIADKVPFKPIYSNGITIMTGLRFNL